MNKSSSPIETAELLVEIVEWLGTIPDEHRSAVGEMMRIDVVRWKKEQSTWPQRKSHVSES